MAINRDDLNIMIVNAIATDAYNEKRLALLRPEAHRETHIDMVSISHGFTSLEYLNEEIVNSYYAIREAQKAEEAGYDAVLINCFCDPGVEEARERMRIPVVGAGEASLCYSARLGHRFAVLSVSQKMIPKIEKSVEKYHLDRKCAGVLSMGIDVNRLQTEGLSEGISAILKDRIQAAIRAGAEVITVGCTASIGIGKLLAPISPIPIVDPAIVSLKITELAGSLYKSYGLSHSKILSYSEKEWLPEK